MRPALTYRPIESLVGIENLTGLRFLRLERNQITDISVLSGLTSLSVLVLWGNSISDLSALGGLTGLEVLRLENNFITDISVLTELTNLRVLELSGNTGLTNLQALLDNTGLGAGDRVSLILTNVSCTDVAALEAKGVDVESECE